MNAKSTRLTPSSVQSTAAGHFYSDTVYNCIFQQTETHATHTAASCRKMFFPCSRKWMMTAATLEPRRLLTLLMTKRWQVPKLGTCSPATYEPGRGRMCCQGHTRHWVRATWAARGVEQAALHPRPTDSTVTSTCTMCCLDCQSNYLTERARMKNEEDKRTVLGFLLHDCRLWLAPVSACVCPECRFCSRLFPEILADKAVDHHFMMTNGSKW